MKTLRDRLFGRPATPRGYVICTQPRSGSNLFCQYLSSTARLGHLEGAAAGAAVLVADHRGLGGLLSTQNHARFCANNFGREVLTRPLDAHAIGAEIDQYDAADAAAVTKLVRDTASLARQLEVLESILGDAISLFERVPATSDARHRALSSYLARHLPRHGEPWPRHAPQAASEPDPRVMHLDHQVSVLTERLSALELQRVLHAACPATLRSGS